MHEALDIMTSKMKEGCRPVNETYEIVDADSVQDLTKYNSDCFQDIHGTSDRTATIVCRVHAMPVAYLQLLISENEEVLMFAFICTDVSHRKQRISTVLCGVGVQCGITNQCVKYVVSYTNSSSANLMHNIGFRVMDQDIIWKEGNQYNIELMLLHRMEFNAVLKREEFATAIENIQKRSCYTIGAFPFPLLAMKI